MSERVRHGLPVLLILAAGCADELGPERRETTRVSGVVREGPRPVRGGWIEFIPTDGTVGNMRSTPIGPDGRFDAVGVPVGANRVGISGARIDLPNWRRYFDPLSTTIERVVPRQPSTGITIDLYEELARRAAGAGR